MEIKNAVYSEPDNSMVVCEVNHPEMGWIQTAVSTENDDRPELVAALDGVDIKPYIAPSDEELIKNAGLIRDEMLKQTDWYLIRQVETAIAVPANVLNYRQALRDIPQQPGYPQQIEWPVLDA